MEQKERQTMGMVGMTSIWTLTGMRGNIASRCAAVPLAAVLESMQEVFRPHDPQEAFSRPSSR